MIRMEFDVLSKLKMGIYGGKLMNKVENMNDNDTIEIIIFGKPKMVEVISTGDSHRKDQERF